MGSRCPRWRDNSQKHWDWESCHGVCNNSWTDWDAICGVGGADLHEPKEDGGQDPFMGCSYFWGSCGPFKCNGILCCGVCCKRDRSILNNSTTCDTGFLQNPLTICSICLTSNTSILIPSHHREPCNLWRADLWFLSWRHSSQHQPACGSAETTTLTQI